jgi:hypothetical protein
MSKKIKFISSSPEYKVPYPIPASKVVPQWYRKMPGSKNLTETVKKCVPFLDALTSGYVITLPVDVYWNEEAQKFMYDSPFSIESDHAAEQTDEVEIDKDYDEQPHKWINRWEIKTPKGYSCLFIHPLERTELPFYSFSGIVDTDKHPLVVNFPFVIKKGFSGLIPAGTPIIQIIPFKRDKWESVIVDDREYNRDVEEYKVQNPPFGWYKRNWWTKKEYR